MQPTDLDERSPLATAGMMPKDAYYDYDRERDDAIAAAKSRLPQRRPPALRSTLLTLAPRHRAVCCFYSGAGARRAEETAAHDYAPQLSQFYEPRGGGRPGPSVGRGRGDNHPAVLTLQRDPRGHRQGRAGAVHAHRYVPALEAQGHGLADAVGRSVGRFSVPPCRDPRGPKSQRVDAGPCAVHRQGPL